MSLALVSPDSEILWTPARRMSDEDIRTHEGTVKLMTEFMAEQRAACLPATFIGLGLAFFVSKVKGAEVCFNPSYQAFGDEFVSKPEGSILIPGRSWYVRRSAMIRALFTLPDMTIKELQLTDPMEARIFAHACDALAARHVFPP